MQNLPSRAWSSGTLVAGLVTVDAQQMKIEEDLDVKIQDRQE